MEWTDVLLSVLKTVAPILLPSMLTWWVMRSKNDADTAKALAEAELIRANADRVKTESRVEKIVSASLGEVRQTLGEHTESLKLLGSDMKSVKHELTTNHGSSVKDAVTRLESGQEALRTQLEVLDGGRRTNQVAIQALQNQMTRVENKIDPMSEDYRRALAEHSEIHEVLKSLQS